MIPLLLDQGLPRSAAQILRQGGWDAIHVGECGLSSATDSVILEYAHSNGRIVCTLDADFHALLAISGASGPSVIRIRREGQRGAEIAALITDIWPKLEEALRSGAIVSVTEHALRFRNLPIIVHKFGG